MKIKSSLPYSHSSENLLLTQIITQIIRGSRSLEIDRAFFLPTTCCVPSVGKSLVEEQADCYRT